MKPNRNNVILLLSLGLLLGACETIVSPVANSANGLKCLNTKTCATTLAWDNNGSGEGVEKYVVHYGPKSRSQADFTGYELSVDAGSNNSVTLKGLGNTAYFVAITAHRGAETSEASEEIVINPSDLVDP